MQGTVLSPLKCSIQVDTLGKEILQDTELNDVLFKFKDFLPIPPLSLIDDMFTVTECGVKSLIMNGLVQSKFDSKRLELSQTKCQQLHIGNQDQFCPALRVRERFMTKATKTKYLGDILSIDTKIDQNIKMRFEKGTGIVNQILSILKEICFGKYYFQTAILLRNALLINGILFNTEALITINNKHIESLQACDTNLMSSLFNCPSRAPREAYYMETSTVSIKFILA